MNFTEIMAVRDKYGADCRLTKDNVKDIYFLTDCNTHGCDSALDGYITSRYPQDTILAWNDEYVNSLLDGCLICDGADESGWEYIKETGIKLQIACKIYTNSYATYCKIIGKLQLFYQNYGYFTNYYFLKKTPYYPYEDRSFALFENIYISVSSGGAPYGCGDERSYLADDGYLGLIPRLNKLCYFDLLSELLTSLFLPVLNGFDDFVNDKTTDIMKKYGVIYLQAGVTDICDYQVRNVFKRYVQEKAFSLPNGFEKMLADFPLNEDNAKEYFFKCKCDLSKIYNRKDDNAKKFASYNIGQKVLDGWTNEWISDQISCGTADKKAEEKLLYVVQNFSDIVDSGNAQKMIDLYNGIKSGTDDSIKQALLYNVEINRITNVTRYYGLIYIAAKNRLCTYLDGLQSELFSLLNRLNSSDSDLIKDTVFAMYGKFGIER